MTLLREQFHGYRNGHQLLESTIRLDRVDQDLVDRLSDMAGQLRPGEHFSPYLTGYALSSGEYYVLAKTWLDVEAPRSGCVLTKSVFIEMSAWKSQNELADLIQSIKHPFPKMESWPDHQFDLQQPISDPRRYEIVEALFLEGRQPIVVFESDQAVAIATRIVNSLWKDLRSQFAFCTFALAPRFVASRPFDLLFAPADARSRFSEWPGRRIEKKKDGAVQSRHRWSADLVSRVFGPDPKRLQLASALGLERDDQRTDEGSLRLSLLWEELSVKAESSPTAVLGLLDILNSRGQLPLDGGNAIFPLAISAIERVVREFEVPSAWEYVNALLTKFIDGAVPPRLRKSFRLSISGLAEMSPDAALRNLETLEAEGRRVAPSLWTWVGDGLAEFARVELIERSSDDVIGKLITGSRAFARELVKSSCANEAAIHRIVSWTRNLDATGRRRFLRHVASDLDDPSYAPLLRVLLHRLVDAEVIRAASRIGAARGFSVSAFDQIFRDNVQDINRLRSGILEFPVDSNSDRFLASTLVPIAESIVWLDGCSDIDAARKARLVVSILRSEPDSMLLATLRSDNVADSVLRCAEGDIPLSAATVARVLRLHGVRSAIAYRLGMSALPFVGDKDTTRSLALSLFEYALQDQSTELVDLKKHIGTFWGYAPSVAQIVESSILRVPAETVFRNLQALRSNPLVSLELVKSVALLSRTLMRRSLDYGEGTYSILSDIVCEADDRRLLSDDVAVSLATMCTSNPSRRVVSVLLSALPVAYRSLKTQFASAHALFPTDHSKRLVKDVVSAFLDSSWPAELLFVCALSTEDPDRFLEELRQRSRGRKYLERMIEGATRLPVSVRKGIEGLAGGRR